MNIDKAARATRKYKMEWMAFDNGSVIEFFSSDSPDNQAACDRLNLRAVLEAIRDTSLDSHRRAVLDAIIEEVGK